MDTRQIVFNNGFTIPARGFSTYLTRGTLEEMKQAVKDAIDVGYRHFDCASVYGTQVAVGEAIKEKIEEGVVKREELFITSKLWNTHHRPDLIEPALMKTLEELQLIYLDLFLMHWPHAFKEGDDQYPLDSKGMHVASNVDFRDTWNEMDRINRTGLVNSIGVANFNVEQIQKLLHNEKSVVSIPVTNQIECHPYLQQTKLRKFCVNHGIMISAYSPLGVPDIIWREEEGRECLDDIRIAILAFRYGRTRTQILLKYNLQLGNIVIVRSFNKERMAENFNILNFNLTENEMEDIEDLECNWRLYTLLESSNHPDYPFRDEMKV